eukprot:CAMPEP_0179494032 /NCGR_PEP_ID=MMETSP0799-20121207/67899_1 /TAXON_ID=46947 /ORGANISM="Geminigera cryophila, Strain CCMP2564" /LENGTH=113 /DNA_ID=CAMNT_0021311511 /DNA_START=282 /DNA_END=623 /DNA_ORIENTATION=-
MIVMSLDLPSGSAGGGGAAHTTGTDRTCASGRPASGKCALIFSTLNLLATDVAALPSFAATSSSILILSILIVSSSFLSLICSSTAGSTNTGGNGIAWRAGAFFDVVASACPV